VSIHLLECAARRAVPTPSHKLVLMAFADSADRHTHIALPGLQQVREWAGGEQPMSKSQALHITAQLVDLGLLTKHRRGHNGKRAEYVVFPDGCCSEHPRPPADEETIGSGTPDPDPPAESGTPDPTSQPGRVWQTGPNTLVGSGLGPAHRTPSPATTTNPPNPPASRGEPNPSSNHTGCQRPGPLPHSNCRGCGTTNRQVAAATTAAAKAARVDAIKAEQLAAREAAAANRRALRDRPRVQELVNATRRSLSRSTT
jgi:hypothetical protein